MENDPIPGRPKPRIPAQEPGYGDGKTGQKEEAQRQQVLGEPGEPEISLFGVKNESLAIEDINAAAHQGEG